MISNHDHDHLAALFQPVHIGKLHLSNRFVMAPMSRYFCPDGIPDGQVAAYYRRRAAGGAGLIITEGAWINDAAAGNDARCPRFYGEEALAAWRNVLTAVHGEGGKIFPQLWHVGAQKRTGDGPNVGVAPRSPSGYKGPGLQVGEPMTLVEIDAAIDAYACAALVARDIGFDGVELHGAHGYLIDQFFWQGSNLRTDRYGGDWSNRMAFAVEVIQEIRRRVGPDFPISLRFSQWKLPDYDARLFESPADLEMFLDAMSGAGVDIFHCSVRRYWDAAFAGSSKTLSGWTKSISGKPTITVGSVGLSEPMAASVRMAKPASLDRLLELFHDSEFDLVAIGRMLIVTPDYIRRIRHEPVTALPAFSPDMIRTHLGSGEIDRLY